MNPETEAILTALLESRKIIEAKMDAMDNRLEAMDNKLEDTNTKLEATNTKLEAVAADVATIKENVSDMNARDQYLMHKTGELEAELFVVKQRQKA